jgi:hypothetical protein
MVSAWLFLGADQAKAKIPISRYLIGALLALILLFILAIIDWPRDFRPLGTVFAFVAITYVFRYIVLPDTNPAELWKHSLWMATVTFILLLAVNAAAGALFGNDARPYNL